MEDEPTAAGMHRSSSRGPSRRTFLVAGGLALVVGGGAGAATDILRSEPKAEPPPEPPAPLVAAVAQERALIASLDAALASTAGSDLLLTSLRSDHLAHEQALLAAVALAVAPHSVPSSLSSPSPTSPSPTSPSSSISSSSPSGAAPAAPTAAELRSAEHAAAGKAASLADAMTGREATLLATIAACEATHAELLA